LNDCPFLTVDSAVNYYNLSFSLHYAPKLFHSFIPFHDVYPHYDRYILVGGLHEIPLVSDLKPLFQQCHEPVPCFRAVLQFVYALFTFDALRLPVLGEFGFCGSDTVGFVLLAVEQRDKISKSTAWEGVIPSLPTPSHLASQTHCAKTRR
jgi:hypothetical protein